MKLNWVQWVGVVVLVVVLAVWIFYPDLRGWGSPEPPAETVPAATEQTPPAEPVGPEPES